jgi:hypothetical protein
MVTPKARCTLNATKAWLFYAALHPDKVCTNPNEISHPLHDACEKRLSLGAVRREMTKPSLPRVFMTIAKGQFPLAVLRISARFPQAFYMARRPI